MKRIFYSLAIALGICGSAVAQQGMSNCMANPEPVTLKQDDGSTVKVRLLGDMKLHYMETMDGYTLVYNSKGNVEYAQRSGDDLIPSGVIAHDAAIRNSDENSFLASSQKHLVFGNAKVQALLNNGTAMNKQNSPNSGGTGQTFDITKRFPTSGNKKVLVILMQFKDYDSTYSQTDVKKMLTQHGYNGTNSFVDFYKANSFNALNLDVDVFGWYTSKYNMSGYGNSNGNGAAAYLVAEAIDAAHNAGVDFSKYDNDGDKYVDGVVVIHAGPGCEQNQDGKYIWSHYYDLSSMSLAKTYNKVTISHYTIQPEKYYSSMIGPGILCHEFGHMMGLPDLYNTKMSSGDYESQGVGNYDVMGGGAWLNSTLSPSSFSAWSKVYFKWVTPTVISTEGSYSLKPSANHNQIYKIKTSVGNEYFLLENRYKNGFDTSLPCHGLAIWHIDSYVMDNTNITWYAYNQVESDPNDPGVYLEQADGNYNLDKNTSNGGNRGDGGDFFPGNTANTSFNDKTIPDAKTWTGKKSGISIQKITKNSDSTVSFNFGAFPSTSFSTDNQVTDICMRVPLKFTNTSNYTTSYKWDFGDGTSIDTGLNATHAYTAAGTYTIKLVGSSVKGSDSSTMKIIVKPLPGAKVTVDGINGGTASIQNLTPNLTSNFYWWVWGDTKTTFQSTKNVTHKYADTGVYNASLIAFGSQCNDTFKYAIHVATMTGIAGEGNTNYSLTAYPNPFSSELNFSLTIDKSIHAEIGIYGLSGQKIRTIKTGDFATGTNNFSISGLDNLSTGIYLIGINAEGQKPSFMKVIKK